MQFQERRQNLKQIDEVLKRIEENLLTAATFAKGANADGILYRISIAQDKIKLLRQKVQSTNDRLLRREQKDSTHVD